MQLSELGSGAEGIIVKVRGRGAFRRRIMEMGFISGRKVKVIKNAPLKDPIEYALMDYRVTLRRSESNLIEVIDENSANAPKNLLNGSKILDKEIRREIASVSNINVAFVGNPNAGKTSVFNFASRSHEHTGNYPGVTIDSKSAQVSHNGYTFHITDLPGTYSLSTYSPEELFVRKYITDSIPDVIVNVVDVSNLERNLFLTTQLIDMDIKVVLALNMYDELVRRKDWLDYSLLSKLIGIPIVPTIGSKGRGISRLFQKIIDIYNDEESSQRHIHINYGDEIETSIGRIQSLIKIPENYPITDKISSRFISIKLLEGDNHIETYLRDAENMKQIFEWVKKEKYRLETLYNDDMISIFTGTRYGFINGALMETYQKNKLTRTKTTEILDSFLTHKVFGFPFFFLFMWIMFAATFKIGKYPQNWIDNGISALNGFLSANMADGSLKDLLINGVLGGVGGVIIFLPNIVILFLFISFMEDSGYMARAVFIMDRLMHRIGLHGKSFIPLIMGFGCNVPAIMATRTIEDRNNRLLTILINPFMSCSARLPVYLLLIGAIFPAFQGLLLFALYLLGILMAIILALIFKKTIFRSEGTPFVMELPPYRMPTSRSTFKHMWVKASQYLKKMSGVILVASIILWALGYFPRYPKILSNPEKNLIISGLKYQGTFTDEILPEETSFQPALDNAYELKNLQLENSYIGRIGKFLEPAIQPLGFDWKMGVSLITGIAAKEVVVSTLGVLNHVDTDVREGKNKLNSRLRDQVYKYGPYNGQRIFSPLSTLSFLIFTLLYFPCIAVFAAVKKETGSLWWAFFMILYTTLFAYLLSLAVFQIGTSFF